MSIENRIERLEKWHGRTYKRTDRPISGTKKGKWSMRELRRDLRPLLDGEDLRITTTTQIKYIGLVVLITNLSYHVSRNAQFRQ